MDRWLRITLAGWLGLWAFADFARTQTAEQNAAAFAAGASQTNLSYHWDAYVNETPVVATTPRTALPYATTLTTISFNPSDPTLYQEKIIGGVNRECVLVGTFANPNNFWNVAGGTELTLTYTVGSTTHYIFPYVTVGNDLHSYLRSTYFLDSTPTDADVALRIDQSLGLSPSIDLTTRGLAFFWVPIDNIVRSGYSPDVSQQVSDLSAFADGSYMPEETGRHPDFRYVDISNNTVRYDTNAEFVEFNQAQTTYPWTAMGYTYNWNALQNGSDPAFGMDPLAPDSFIGLPEFMISGGSQIVLESWIPYADFDLWIIPEPGSVGLFLFGVLVAVARRSERRNRFDASLACSSQRGEDRPQAMDVSGPA